MNTKRTTSRLLSVLLCLVMVLGLLPTAAFAAEESDNTYPKAVGILERKQGTKNILTTDGLYNGGLRPVYYYDAKKYAGVVDDAGKNIEYADIEAAKTAGCVAYLDADGVYHFLTNVTDESAYYPGEVGVTENKNSKYTNRLSIYRTYVAGPFTKIKIVVHEGLTVNLKYLNTYATTEIVLEEGSKLIIDNTSGGPWDYYNKYSVYKYEPAGLWVGYGDDEMGDLTISGSGTLIVNYETVSKEVFARGTPALLVLGALTIKDNVNVEVNATQSSQKRESGHCIQVYGDTNINTTGYVKANLINLTSTNVNAIQRRGIFHVTNASYVEISSACLSDYGYLMFDQDYEALGKNTISFPGWNIETKGSEVSIDGIASSLLTLKKSYAKFTRDGVSDAKLTP